jgi:multidrug resistance efflux pump
MEKGKPVKKGEVLAILDKIDYEIQTMHTKEASLEEIFIKVTGRSLR